MKIKSNYYVCKRCSHVGNETFCGLCLVCYSSGTAFLKKKWQEKTGVLEEKSQIPWEERTD